MKKIIMLLVLFLFSITMYSQDIVFGEISELGEKYTKKRKNYGLVIGVVQGDAVKVFSFGKKSKLDSKVPNGQTIFEIGSVTGVFTTTLMQLLADQRRFNRGAPVKFQIDNASWIPSYRPLKCRLGSYYESASCVEDQSASPQCFTFCNLAAHVAGFPSDIDGYHWSPIEGKTNENDFQTMSINTFQEKLENLKFVNEPGKYFHYSDVGIALLGILLSEKTETPFEDLLKTQLLDTLKMNDTRIVIPSIDRKRLVKGHNHKGKPVPPYNFGAFAPAAGLYSTADDLLKFIVANLDTDAISLERAFNEVQQSKVTVRFKKGNRPTWMGYGWFTSILNETTNLPIIWMNGGTGGMRSFVGFNKDKRVGVVLLSNSVNGVDDMGFEILELLVNE